MFWSLGSFVCFFGCTQFGNIRIQWNFELTVKLGIHLRQRQAKARCGSLSLASVDGATNWVACLRSCCDPSHRLSVDQSETSPRNSPPHAQYGWNMPRLAETKKILQSTARRIEDAALRLGLLLLQMYSRLNASGSVDDTLESMPIDMLIVLEIMFTALERTST